MLSIFKRRRAINLLVLGTLLLILSGVRSIVQTTAAPKIFAQKLVEEALAAHPELMGLEIAAAPPGKAQCVTIASNEIKGIGEKCDKDEFIAMKTNKPFVEKEKESGKEVYDVTVAIHDINGKIIGTAGIDFKPGKALPVPFTICGRSTNRILVGSGQSSEGGFRFSNVHLRCLNTRMGSRRNLACAAPPYRRFRVGVSAFNSCALDFTNVIAT